MPGAIFIIDVKREHIAWFDDADTDAKKEAIFKGMRNGTYRVLIGSAKKMGTGVNVQNRLTALHYMDPPWFPADVEQPRGRIIRQGNQNAIVDEQWYATKGGYDSTMWQMVGRKQRFIDLTTEWALIAVVLFIGGLILFHIVKFIVDHAK